MDVIEQWFCVWCQGGRANDWRYMTLIEPDDEITLVPIPNRADDFVRVPPDDESWPNAIVYRRARDVEQIDGECIYYPADVA